MLGLFVDSRPNLSDFFLHFGNFFHLAGTFDRLSVFLWQWNEQFCFYYSLFPVVVVSSPCCAAPAEQNLNSTASSSVSSCWVTPAQDHTFTFTRAHTSHMQQGMNTGVWLLCLLSGTSSERQELEVDKDHSNSLKNILVPKTNGLLTLSNS